MAKLSLTGDWRAEAGTRAWTLYAIGLSKSDAAGVYLDELKAALDRGEPIGVTPEVFAYVLTERRAQK